MLKKLVHFFLSKELVNSSLQSPESLYRPKVQIAVALVGSVFIFFMFLVRFSLEGFASSKTLFLLPIIASFLLLIPLSVKFFNRYTKAICIATILGAAIVLFKRIPSTGGIISPVSLWYILHPIQATVMISPRAGLFFGFFSIFQLMILANPHLFGISINEIAVDPNVYFAVISILILIASFIIYFYEKQRMENEKTILDSEKLIIDSTREKALGSLSGSFAHEINNPLAIIKANLEVMQKNLQSKEKIEKVPNQMNSIHQNIKRIETIINVFKTFSLDSSAIEMEQVNLSACLSKAIETLKDLFPAQLRLINELRDTELYIIGNKELLIQAFTNILKNSIESIEKNDKAYIKIYLKSSYPVTIAIEDSGKMISEDIAKDITEPFFTTKPMGMGLGLSLSHNIMLLHRGKLSLNQESSTTEFLVEFQGSSRFF